MTENRESQGPASGPDRLDVLVSTSTAVRATRSRKKKTGLLSAYLRSLRAESVPIAVAYLTGELPQKKIGLGWAALKDARGQAVAPQTSLTLLEVDRTFSEIRDMTGKGSVGRRKARLGSLFAAATAEERAFLSGLVIGELRQGAVEGVMIEAVAEAAELPAVEVRRAVMTSGQLASVAAAALTDGRAALAQFGLRLFQPLKPMLASPVDDLEGVFEVMPAAAWERKLDGARVQVHKQHGEVRVYSRGLNDVTEAVPEVVAAALAIDADPLIVDGEAIALKDDGTPHPFQHTMRRFGRKANDKQTQAALPLSVFFFDLLRADAEDILDQDLADRIETMQALIPSEHRVDRIVTDDVEQAEAFWRQALDAGHEGVMAKALDTPYEAGGRSKQWLKVKPAHTLDLVVIAVERGSGRRAGWLSNLHLAARDPVHETYVMLGKTFKGMTDQMLQWQTDYLQKIALGGEDYVIHVEPKLVVEVAFSNVQASPQYPSGMALRFARVKRYRLEKTVADADTIDTVRQIFQGAGKHKPRR